MKDLYLVSVPLDNDLLRFTLSHCVDPVERLILESCSITNEIVEQLTEVVKKRQKPVKCYIEFFYTRFCEIFVIARFMPHTILKNGW